MLRRRAATTPERRRPRLAFAGSGTITVLHGLVTQVLETPVVLVASRRPDHARERAGQLDAEAVTYEELPGSADLVIVATPPNDHAAQARRTLAAGVATLVERPLCATLEEADELIALAAAGGAPLAYGENLLHAPAVIRSLELIGSLGPLVHLEAHALQSPPERGALDSAERGGGVLFELGVQPLAIVLQAVAAPVVDVRANLERSPGLEVDDHAVLDITFAGGLTARVVASWREPQAVWDLQAASDRGVVRLELLPNFGLEHNGDPVELAAPTFTDVPQLEQLGYTAQLASVLDDTVNRRHPRVDGKLGRRVLEVICAAYRSAGNGERPEPIPFEGPRDRTPLELWLAPS